MKKRVSLKIFAIVMTALLVFSGSVWAVPVQDNDPVVRGSNPQEYCVITGRVTDVHGVGVADARIEIWDEATMARGWVVTDSNGYYTITGLPAGTYVMKVYPPEGVNLVPAFINDIVVIVGETTTVDVILKEGGIVTPAMATAEPPVVDRVDAFASSSNDFKEQVLALQDLNPKIDPLIEQEMKIRPDEKIPIIIVLKDQHLKDIPERFDVKEAKSLARSSQKSLASSIKQMQAVEMRQHWIINAISVKVPAEEIDEIAARQDVEKVWLDAEIKLIEPVVTPLTDQADYGDENINAHLLWDMGFNGTGINISILDTGIDTTHPDLDEGKVIFEKDFTGEGTTDDLRGHGTHVAGIAAGRYNEAVEVRGVAPNASLLNARVLGQGGYGLTSWIISGIEWSIEQEADILCMSLGMWQKDGTGRDPLSLAVTNAVEEWGVIVVVSAGNRGPGEGTIGSPAVAYGAIAVAASDSEDRIADFSSRGPTRDGRVGIDIAAPGQNIIAPNADWENQADHIHYCGTSMSAPHAAGAVALLLDAFYGDDLRPEDVERALKNSAFDIDYDILEQGAGRLDVLEAYYNLKEGISVDHEWSAGTHLSGTHISKTFTIENKCVNATNVSITKSTGDAGG
ncbi:MAG: S8 family serine peptidase, partial [Methanophagales archaeon]|nr:S8 family serine peptidase [Methanophagales archaeon]